MNIKTIAYTFSKIFKIVFWIDTIYMSRYIKKASKAKNKLILIVLTRLIKIVNA